MVFSPTKDKNLIKYGYFKTTNKSILKIGDAFCQQHKKIYNSDIYDDRIGILQITK